MKMIENEAYNGFILILLSEQLQRNYNAAVKATVLDSYQVDCADLSIRVKFMLSSSIIPQCQSCNVAS